MLQEEEDEELKEAKEEEETPVRLAKGKLALLHLAWRL